MQNCLVRICTSADGTESNVTRVGELTACGEEVALTYREENAIVRMHWTGEGVRLERDGDYRLRLRLKQGKAEVGEIGIGGATGEIRTFTDKIFYSLADGELRAILHYDLLLSGERQKMRLKIQANVTQ